MSKPVRAGISASMSMHLTHLASKIPAGQDWMEHAECATTGDPDAWYPADAWTKEAEMAREICKGCPVVSECLKHALDNGELYGTWGGMSAGERKRLRERAA